MRRSSTLAFLAAILLVCAPRPAITPACCPAPRDGSRVVNADQTVILLWDAAKKTEHFIRKASFKSDSDDFGFIVPSPSVPELAEAGDSAFPFLQKLTAPEVEYRKRPDPGMSCGCSSKSASVSASGSAMPVPVTSARVLAEKDVAGFNAVVLAADSTSDLTDWLREHQFAYSPEIAAWAEPYVQRGWKFTALKVAKQPEEKDQRDVAAAALRISFQTEQPLFPYREPDFSGAAKELGAMQRMLRIYFLADARYDGALRALESWSGRVAWSGPVSTADRQITLDLLKLPQSTGPANWRLTEFEDRWPYRVAPSDLYFAKADKQDVVKRPPIILYITSREPVDATALVIVAMLAYPALRRKRRIGVCL